MMNTKLSFLDEIMAHKRDEVARERVARPLAEVRAAAEAAPRPLDFVAALRGVPARPALIAEIKRRSPSRGLLAPDFDPLRLARIYRENGAACISVLTDEKYFGGSLAQLAGVRGQEPGIPLLRKDFICDPYQVVQARAAGADAVLLIVAALSPEQLRDLHALARALGMAALIEVHAAAELETALACAPALVGINNRDLHTFTVDLATTERLAQRIPPEICVVAESGIHGPGDLARLAAIPRPGGARGIEAILVGEALVTAADVGAKVRDLTRPGVETPG
jgi:indole-3-glycerol phosphate synthase